jgi:DNA ligase-3
VGNGFDDATLDALQTSLAVTKISRDPSRVPSWLIINKNDLAPDFIVNDPKVSERANERTSEQASN